MNENSIKYSFVEQACFFVNILYTFQLYLPGCFHSEYALEYLLIGTKLSASIVHKQKNTKNRQIVKCSTKNLSKLTHHTK